MIDLCGGFLSTFVLGELLPVVSRHPRFRDNDGSGLISFSNLIAYKDVSLQVGDIRTDGNRLSPDNYMCTLHGKVCAAKLDGANGSFVEWTRETDAAAIPPGLYYLGIEAVNEETREVKAVMQPYRWMEGRLSQGAGSYIHVASGISAYNVEPTDPAVEFMHASGNRLLLLTFTDTLSLRTKDTHQLLQAGTDWWVETREQQLLVTTTGGVQRGVPLPEGVSDFVLLEHGVELRQGYDWDYDGEGQIRLPAWTLAGSPIYIDGTFRSTPSGLNYIHPENFIDANRTVEETPVPEQCALTLRRGVWADALVWLPDGRAVFKHLMTPSDQGRWELRIKRPQVYKTFKKMAVNPEFLPGLSLAVGDMVEAGDQIALIVFPRRCEIYEVYGSKEGVTFDLTVKANDLLTATELAQLARTYLAVAGRDRLEAAGLTIQSISQSSQGGQKDSSGTATTYSVVLSVSALADWELHKPLVNRVDDIEVDFTPISFQTDFQVMGEVTAFGQSQFTPAYM